MYDIVDVYSVHLSEHVHYAQNPIITFKIGFHYTLVKGLQLCVPVFFTLLFPFISSSLWRP